MRKLYAIIIAFFTLCTIAHTQSIPWGTFCGSAGTQTTGAGTFIYTLGGCPGCEIVQGPIGALVPPFVDDGNPDCFTNSFDFDSEVSDCGMVFNFFYIGNADVNAVNFDWDFGPTAFPQTSTLINPIGVSFSSAGNKQVTLRIFTDSCDVSATMMINVEQTGFAANPIVQDVSCKGDSNGSIVLELNGGTAPYTYLWSNGETTASINNIVAGDYAYTVTDATGCSSVNGIAVAQPSDSLSIAFDKTPETCNGDLDGSATLFISGGTAPYAIVWEDGGSTAMNRADLASGMYQVNITDNNGCQAEGTVFIDQSCNPRLYNTISPNGDGINDVWTINDIQDYPENELQIFNRWGEKVFNTTSYDNTWNGVNNKKEPLSAGAYYYVLRLNDEDNSVVTGSITIVR